MPHGVLLSGAGRAADLCRNRPSRAMERSGEKRKRGTLNGWSGPPLVLGICCLDKKKDSIIRRNITYRYRSLKTASQEAASHADSEIKTRKG